jgi:hypothetical protein
MDGDRTAARALRLLPGGRQVTARLDRLLVAAAPEDAPPFPVAGRAFEEDTFLVMSADPRVAEPEIHPLRLMRELANVRPAAPGGVVVRPGAPMRFLAIVHDLNQDPTWREEWVAGALQALLGAVEARRLAALALPLLGTRHGRLAPERFGALLAAALRSRPPRHLRRLWLVVPPGAQRQAIADLATAWGQQS